MTVYDHSGETTIMVCNNTTIPPIYTTPYYNETILTTEPTIIINNNINNVTKILSIIFGISTLSLIIIFIRTRYKLYKLKQPVINQSNEHISHENISDKTIPCGNIPYETKIINEMESQKISLQNELKYYLQTNYKYIDDMNGEVSYV